MRIQEGPAKPGPKVQIAGGAIRGARIGGNFAWRGIPYAAPPVGELRFRAPQPVEPWTGTRDASKYGKVATQVHFGQLPGRGAGLPAGEDCLTLNVLRAAHARVPEQGMPVMVYIHGGGYSAGSSRDALSRGD